MRFPDYLFPQKGDFIFEQEIACANEYVQTLQAEWTASQQWADLSCFDRVDVDQLRPAAEAAQSLCIKMAAQLQEEATRLERLRKIKQDSKNLYGLIQSQVVIEISCIP